jgi:hypothetical protein
MKLSPHPHGLGGPVGGRNKCVVATITNYCHADLLSSVTTITQPEMPTITAGAPTIMGNSVRDYYHHNHAGGGIKNDAPVH